MQLHRPICHTGLNTANHCTAEEEWEGEVLLHNWQLGAARRRLQFWELFLEAREHIPKIFF